MSYDIRIKTAGKLGDMETWLQVNAKGKWFLKFESATKGSYEKAFILSFVNEADRTAFRQRFSAHALG